MKVSLWNILTIAALLALTGVTLIFLTIFINPATPINPFPPPTLPAELVLPSATPRLKALPATWTPHPNNNSQVFLASQTPQPPSMVSVLPTLTYLLDEISATGNARTASPSGDTASAKTSTGTSAAANTSESSNSTQSGPDIIWTATPKKPAATLTPTAKSPKPTATFTTAPPSTLSSYYVSPSGSDQDPGTIDRPFRSIHKAISLVKAGDTIYLREGTYTEYVRIDASGTAEKPIQLVEYPGENAVINGNNQIPDNFNGLVSLYGSWITVKDIEVKNSQYVGIGLFGTHITVSNTDVHHNQSNGVLILGDYGTVVNSSVWRNSILNEYNRLGSYSSGISAARDLVNGVTENAVIKGNTVWENWGEGISSFEASGTTIENNISHDNLSANIYISDSTNVTCSGNLAYMDPSSYIYGYDSHIGIMMGDETYSPSSANIKVINNIAYGNMQNFSWWQGLQGGGMINVLVANNTFVNAAGSQEGTGDVTISRGDHQNSFFMNNIVSQDGSLMVIATIAQPGLTYSNNLWSKEPLAAAAGSGDVVANPQFSQSGSPFAVDWFQLLGSSPAVGMAVPLPETASDFLHHPRDSQPDIGALEYIP